MRKIIYLIILTIFITSCSEDPLEGKVYVIKENGSIVPAAAREVFILPYATLEDFSEALAKEESKIERTSLNNYVSLMCETHADNLSKLKESLLDFQPLPKDHPPLSFDSLKKDRDAIDKHIQEKADELKTLAEEQIITTNECSGTYPTVGVINKTKYIIANTKGAKLYARVNNTNSSFCEYDIRSRQIFPGRSISYNLGECGSVGIGNWQKEAFPKWIDEGKAELCTTGGYAGVYPKHDWFGPSWFSGRGWDFVYADRPFMEVDFSIEARKEDSVIQKEKSYQHKLLLLRTRELESLTCPTKGAERSTIESFRSKALSLGSPTSALPMKHIEFLETFVKKNAVLEVKTNITGDFYLDEPPKTPFLIYTNYRDSENAFEWLIPLTKDIKKIELSNSDAIDQKHDNK